MIVVSTNGDPVAKVLDSYAQEFLTWAVQNGSNGIIHRGPPASTSWQIQNDLQQNRLKSFYFFGHGSAVGLRANDGMPAIDQSTAHLLQGRVVSATCCHGDQLGQVAAKNAFTLLGYDGVLWVPRQAPYIDHMKGPALEGPKGLALGNSPSQCVQPMRRAYHALARTLHAGNSSNDKAFALFVSINASRITSW